MKFEINALPEMKSALQPEVPAVDARVVFDPRDVPNLTAAQLSQIDELLASTDATVRQEVLDEKLASLGMGSFDGRDTAVVTFIGADGSHDLRAINVTAADFGTRVRDAELIEHSSDADAVFPVEGEVDSSESEAIEQGITELRQRYEASRANRDASIAALDAVGEDLKKQIRALYEGTAPERHTLEGMVEQIRDLQQRFQAQNDDGEMRYRASGELQNILESEKNTLSEIIGEYRANQRSGMNIITEMRECLRVIAVHLDDLTSSSYGFDGLGAQLVADQRELDELVNYLHRNAQTTNTTVERL